MIQRCHTRVQMGLGILVLLSGCEASVESRFSAMCVEASGSREQFARSAADLCTVREGLTNEDKERFLQAWHNVKKSKATLDSVSEEGRRKGYTK